MTSPKRSGGIRLILAGLLVASNAAAFAAGPSPPPAPDPATRAHGGVLVLYAYGRLLPGNVAFEKGLRQVLADGAAAPVEQFDEFLDVPRFASEAHLLSLERYLREKYAERPPGALVVVGEAALRFLLDRRESLFAGIPVILGAIDRDELASLGPLRADILGAPIVLDFAGTIAQALEWHPQAKRLVLITGSSTKDRDWEARLRRECRPLEKRILVEPWTAPGSDELQRRLHDLGPDDIVFTPGFFQDGEGRITSPRDIIAIVAAGSAAPVYSPFFSPLGSGVVGGRMTSFESMGREAGRTALRYFAGEPVAALQFPAPQPAPLTVDWRQIRRWRIDSGAVPSDAVILFRDPTFFESYRFQVLLVSSVVALQAGLIALLLVERRRLRDAQAVEHELRLELAHASRLAVAGELMGSIAHEINQPLGAILANADAADLILATGADRRADLAAILHDIRSDDLRASEVIRKLRSFLARHEVERRPFEVQDAMHEVEALLKSEARRRRVTLEVLPSALSARVLGDRIQIQQVLLNLVLNAMDAVAEVPDDRRTVALSVRIARDGVEIRVSDRGHGVPTDQLPKLFDSFYTTKRQGMGLGLSIARTLVEAHGGRIWVDSRPGEKTTFHVLLPEVQSGVRNSLENR
jgi:signal transduction histidine kinase